MANSVEAAKAAGVRERENSISTEWDAEQWTLYVDDASNDTGSRAGMMLAVLNDTRYIVPYTLDLRH